jgi:alkanesulfonate monooxygenase SsuD/methylene tetrahydromethanopterin reductase-like flavin-dependent oxidoreductase (luciferase family)
MVGLFLPNAEAMMDGDTPGWADLLRMARRAEEIGFDSVWVLDHLLVQLWLSGWEGDHIGCWECWSLLAALAAATDRIALGPLVSCTGFRNPALLAKMADTVDEISGGRLILGLGAGWHTPEFDAFGFPFDHRVSRFEEALKITVTLLREGRIDFEGQYYSARECELRSRGPRSSGPPILVGAHGKRMLRLTAQYADAWNADWYTRPEEVPALRAEVDAACAAVGRDPATLARTLALLVDAPGWRGRASANCHTDLRAAIGPPASGSAEELATVLRGFAAAGITHVQVWLEPNSLAGIEAFAAMLAHLDRG